MKNIDALGHLSGQSKYLDDLPVEEHCLHAYVVTSPHANGVLKSLDKSMALKIEGVLGILTADDIPGENQIGAIIKDEPLFAEKHVHFIGQPIAMVVAKDKRSAKLAAKAVILNIKADTAVTDPLIAYKKGDLIMPPRTFQQGDTAIAWEKCAHIIEGKTESPGQEHLYLEAQGAYALPGENGKIFIYSSTQGPTAVQRIVARILNLPMHKIEVDVTRLGGGFGGKEDQATPWAAMAALASLKFRKGVKLVLDRDQDMMMTGKRHPYTSYFKIGLDTSLKIKAFEADYYQNAGAAADLSPAIVERTLFHSTGSYFIPNVRVTAYSCRTNLPPNTAFRGFGAPQAFFVIESAIRMAAEKIGVQAEAIQKENLIDEDQSFPFGQITEAARAKESWNLLSTEFQLENKIEEIKVFNQNNTWIKKGYATFPICFGISFTNTMMNHSRALVHIYSDGSVGISTAAVEMGQGVNTKMIQIAAKSLSIKPERIRIETANTSRVANTSPTAASSAIDLNGHAVRIACKALLNRLLSFGAKSLGVEDSDLKLVHEQVFSKGEITPYNWKKLVGGAFEARCQLSEVGHYATPNIFFDKSKEKGHPFAYHVYGNALSIVELDCLRGTYKTDSVSIVHDFGKSLNTAIDRGQVEGALLQGMGWLTMEDLRFDKKGRLLSNALSTYKIPDIHSAPGEVKLVFLPNPGTSSAIFQSKAIGEPPFMYGMASFFALIEAIRSFNPKFRYDGIAPLTPEKVLMALYKG